MLKQAKFTELLLILLILFTFSCKNDQEKNGITPDTESSKPEEAYPKRCGTFRNGKLFGKSVTYQEIEGNAVLEGDIILSPDQLNLENSRISGTGRTSLTSRWPGNVVYYTIDPLLPDQARVTGAISHWESKTCIRFVVRTNQSNYITFKPGEGCSSNVGMIGGQQFINLATTCSTGNAIHEIGHAAGLWHEHTRADRDNSITVNFANISTGLESNFQTYVQRNMDGFDNLTLDFGSVMMYDSYAFSSNGKPTIVKRDGSTFTVQRNTLSAEDVACINIMYNCGQNSRLAVFHQGQAINKDSWYSILSPVNATWGADQKISNTNMSESPGLVVYNGRTYFFHHGINNDRTLWYNVWNGTTWTGDVKVASTNLTGSPAVVVFNNKIYCFHQGNISDGTLWYNVFNGTTWEGDKRISDVCMSSSPSAVVYNGKIYCFHQGCKSDGTLWYNTFTGTTWEGDKKVSGVGMSASPSATVYNNKIYCFHQGSNNNSSLWYNTFNGSAWEGDISVPGVNLSDSPSATVFNNKIYCFHQGRNNDGSLWYNVLNMSSWEGDKRIPNIVMSSSPCGIVMP